jgi:hypothetical protein
MRYCWAEIIWKYHFTALLYFVGTYYLQKFKAVLEKYGVSKYILCVRELLHIWDYHLMFSKHILELTVCPFKLSNTAVCYQRYCITLAFSVNHISSSQTEQSLDWSRNSLYYMGPKGS